MNNNEIENNDLNTSAFNRLLKIGELDIYGNPMDWDTTEPCFSETQDDDMEKEEDNK